MPSFMKISTSQSIRPTQCPNLTPAMHPKSIPSVATTLTLDGDFDAIKDTELWLSECSAILMPVQCTSIKNGSIILELQAYFQFQDSSIL